MKKCQECGALIRGKVSFCPKCAMPTDEMMKKDTFVKYKTAKVICTSKSLSNFWGAYHSAPLFSINRLLQKLGIKMKV